MCFRVPIYFDYLWISVFLQAYKNRGSDFWSMHFCFLSLKLYESPYLAC